MGSADPLERQGGIDPPNQNPADPPKGEVILCSCDLFVRKKSDQDGDVAGSVGEVHRAGVLTAGRPLRPASRSERRHRRNSVAAGQLVPQPHASQRRRRPGRVPA